MKLITDYPQVRVIDAKGFEDYEGWLLLRFESADGRSLCVVGCFCEGKHDFEVHPAVNVHLMEK